MEFNRLVKALDVCNSVSTETHLFIKQLRCKNNPLGYIVCDCFSGHQYQEQQNAFVDTVN